MNVFVIIKTLKYYGWQRLCKSGNGGSKDFKTWTQITDLSEGFSLAESIPFSIYLKPIGEMEVISVMVSCKLLNDDDLSPFPVGVESWSEGAFKELGVDAIDLDVYNVYWGAGL